MPDSKITALTSISTSTDPANDPLVIVDVSDTSMAATGTTKKVTLNQLLGTSPTATLASATITGAATVGTTLGVTGVSTLTGNAFANGSATVAGGTPGAFANAALTINNRGGVSDLSLISLGYRPNGTVLNGAAYIGFITTSGAGNVLGDLIFGTRSVTTDTAPTERYRIDSTGIATWSNVGGVAGTAMTLNANGLGIGVTPSYKLDVLGVSAATVASGAAFRAIRSSSGDRCLIVPLAAGSGFTIQSQNAAESDFAPIIFSGSTTAFNYRTGVGTVTTGMTLAASGNLLLGTVTDIAAIRMQVWSSESNNTAYFRNSNATPYGPSIKYTAATPNNTGSEFLYCEDNTALRVALRSNGGIANYQANDVSLSDSRLKTDIKPLASYWNKIKSLELVTFKYKDQTHSDDNIGLIAQQVESVAPELVDVDGFGETPVDGVPLKTIYTTDLYHAAIKALQEAMTRIEALEAKLA